MSDTASTILTLAVIAMLEGVRRLPPGAFVLRRILGGHWYTAAPLDLGRDWFLAAWPVPLVHFVVVTRDDGDETLGISRHFTRLRARARRARLSIAALRVWGTLILIGLVVGLPLAIQRWDAFGLVVSVEALVVMCAVQALVAHIGLRRAGAAKRPALVASLKMLWPFSAPCAAATVQKQVVQGAPWIVAVVELFGRERCMAQMRTGLYDELERDERGMVSRLFGRETITAFLRQPSDGARDPFCPRCGARYREGIAQCADCAVALVS